MSGAHRRTCACSVGLALLVAVAPAARAQPAGAWEFKPSALRLGYETLSLPAGEKMGLVGTTYLVQVHDFACIGPAAYGAASGERGGLFTVGVDAALCARLFGRLSAEAGLYVGGGGGGGAPVGGGLMLRPYANLLWDFGWFHAGVSVSKVRFPSGSIDSNQVGAVVDLATDFGFMPPAAAGSPVRSGPAGGLGFDRIRAVFGAYAPRSGTLGTDGSPLAGTIGLVGVRAESSFGRIGLYGVEAGAAASGGAAGYAEFLGTLGVLAPLDAAQRFALGGRVALGMGGGGAIPTGGGLLAKAAVNADWRAADAFGLGLEAGWTYAPQGSFSAPYATLALRWDLTPPPGKPGTRVRGEWSAGVEYVRDAARKAGPSKDMQQVSLRYARFVGDRVYLNGQLQSAYAGDAGAFSVGLFGLGVQWPIGSAALAGVELAAGAAGGGGVDTGGGAVIKPMAYLGWRLSPLWSLRLGGGWLKAVNGGLSSPVADLTLVLSFDVAGR
jgi:hypothetical protein